MIFLEQIAYVVIIPHTSKNPEITRNSMIFLEQIAYAVIIPHIVCMRKNPELTAMQAGPASAARQARWPAHRNAGIESCRRLAWNRKDP